MEHKPGGLLAVKPCYEHLGGALGARLFSKLVELGWFERDPAAPRGWAMTAEGRRELQRLGVDIFSQR